MASEAETWTQCLTWKKTFYSSVQEVRRLLEDKADPNCRFRYKLGSTTFEGTPLTYVVKLNQPNCLDVLRLLLEEKANVGSQYWMKLGSSDVYHGVAVCAACASGNISVLKLLQEHDAPLSGRLGLLNHQPNSTLLYEATCFGHADVVQYLLEQKHDPDVQVTCHDDLKQRTIIETAAVLGHEEVMKALLATNVQITQDVLRAAIDGGHQEILKQIVKDGAQMFTPSFVLHEGEKIRAIDYVFAKRNAMLVAAVAQGLWCRVTAVDNVWGMSDELKEELEKITFFDLLRFLDTPDAHQILGVVFRRYECQYRDPRRQLWKIADIGDGDLNVALGPAKVYFDDRPITPGYQKSTEEAAFERRLGFHSTYGKQVPAEVFYCSFPWLHRHPEVLRILASQRNPSAFDEKGARAIVRVAWEEAKLRHSISFALDLLAALLFFDLALVLSGEHWWQNQKWHPPVILTLLFLIWIKTLIWEMLQIWGFQLNGSGMLYLGSMENLADILRIVLTGVMGVIITTDWELARGQLWRVGFATTGFLWWLRVLNTVKGFESTGESMLPILKATFATGPFLFVVFCFIAGFWHVYYSFGFSPWKTAWMTMFRLGFLADAGLLDSANEPRQWETWVDLILMVVALWVAIVLLNILVGVFSESYSAGYADRRRLFLTERCRVLSNHFAMDAAISWKCCRRPRIDATLRDWVDPEKFDRVWYVSKREKAPESKQSLGFHKEVVPEISI